MCTVVALHGVRADAPLIVAANRDEFYARATTGPQLLDEGIVGGRDELALGTWLGVTRSAPHETGLVVAVTNQRTHRLPDPGRRSRGELVLEALRARSVAGVEALLRRIDAREYNPFNLLFGDGASLRVAYARDHVAEIAVEPHGPGVWILANDRIDAPDYPKTRRADALVRPHVEAPLPALVDALKTMLGDHEKPDAAHVPGPQPGSPFSHALLRELQALCIHTSDYGTRSSTIVTLGEDRKPSRYLHAEGPPCTAPFVDFTHLTAR